MNEVNVQSTKSVWLFFLAFAAILIVVSIPQASLFISNIIKALTSIDVSGLFATLRSQSASLYLLFVISVFMEIRDREALTKIVGTNVSEAKSALVSMIDALQPNALLTAVAAKALVSDRRLETFVRNVLPPKHIYDALKVSIRLTGIPSDPQSFSYEQICDFRIVASELVIAVIKNPYLQDKVFELDFVDEVFCDSGLDHNAEYVTKFCASLSCSAVKESATGALAYEKLKIEKFQPSKVQISSDIGLLEEVVFLRIVLPNSSGANRIVLTYPPARFLRSAPYVYWISDRTLFLDSIQIDARDFFDLNQGGKFNIMTNISGFSPQRSLRGILEKDMPVKLSVESWACYGQGIFISWKV